MSDTAASLNEKYKLVADTIRCYPMQLKESWDSVASMYIPDEYKEVENAVLCGMGGSALGGRIADALFSERIRVPFEIFNSYDIPNYVNDKTLVICSSYSGTTEETVDFTYKSIQKGAKVFGITTGNKLKDVFTENDLPVFVIDENQNPSKQPRMSIGYSTGSILSLFNRLGIISVLEEEITEAVNSMNEAATEFNENIPASRNVAKSIFEKTKRKGVVIVASEHLVGAAHTIKNQFNENAKTFSTLFELPELNHHLMEGLQFPMKLKENLIFLLICSNLYDERVQKRYKVTRKVLEKSGYDVIDFIPNSAKKLAQAFELIMMGSFVTFFLTKEYKIDPLAIPWVDYFKKEMGK